MRSLRVYHIGAMVIVLAALLAITLLIQMEASRATFLRTDEPNCEPAGTCQNSIEFGFGLDDQTGHIRDDLWAKGVLSLPVSATVTISDTGVVVASQVFTAARISPTLHLTVETAPGVLTTTEYYYARTSMTPTDTNYISGPLPMNGDVVITWENWIPAGTQLVVTLESKDTYTDATLSQVPHFTMTSYPNPTFPQIPEFVVRDCPPYSLTVAVEPEACRGCSVLQSPDPPYTQTLTVTLEPVAGSGWVFGAWQGRSVSELVPLGDEAWWIEVDGHKQLTATFEKKEQNYVYLPQVVRDFPFTVRPPISGWITILDEGFEDVFPSEGWAVTDDDETANGEYYWGKRLCRPLTGQYSAWAVGAGADGGGLQCGDDYPNNADTWMRYGPFNLADATDAKLTFQTWLDLGTGQDRLCRMASKDGNQYSGFCTFGNTSGWVEKDLDLTIVPQLGDLTGEEEVYIAFIFTSDASGTTPEGVYVDDVLLRMYIPPPTETLSLEIGPPVALFDQADSDDFPAMATFHR